MKRFIIYTVFLVLSTFVCSLSAQNDRLAKYYYEQGEYEKSASLFADLVKKQPNRFDLFESYVLSLGAIPDMDGANAIIDQRMGQKPNQSSILNVLKFQLALQEGDVEAGEQYLSVAKETLPDNPNDILVITNRLVKNSRYEDAIDFLLTAEKSFNLKGAFEREIAEYYRFAGDYNSMIDRQILLLVKYPNMQSEIEQSWLDYLSEKEYKYALKRIFGKIQDHPDSEVLTDLLSWTYVRIGDYGSAVDQAIAMDRRGIDRAQSINDLGQQALKARHFEEASRAFQYLIDSQDKTSSLYVAGKYGLLKAFKNQYSTGYSIDTSRMESINKEYQKFFDEFPVTNQNIMMLRDWGYLLAFELSRPNESIRLMESYINQAGLNRSGVANLKLLLGDTYLLTDDQWESTLYYSQVDKEFKEGALGEEARFRNAKLSYYLGNFEWSQDQFDVLKSATSRLIANDAIEISVFITDNLGLDTSTQAISRFSDAEFLRFKKDYGKAEDTFLDLLKQYPNHSLTDDVLFELGNLYRDQRVFDVALKYYSRIVREHCDDIKCDNALMEMAKIYDYGLSDSDTAIGLYERIFTEFSFSNYAVQARERFRVLRGDNLQ